MNEEEERMKDKTGVNRIHMILLNILIKLNEMANRIF